jgi:hypothetical protein
MKPAHDPRRGKIFYEGWRMERKTVNDGLMTGALRTGKPGRRDIKTRPTKGA